MLERSWKKLAHPLRNQTKRSKRGAAASGSQDWITSCWVVSWRLCHFYLRSFIETFGLAIVSKFKNTDNPPDHPEEQIIERDTGHGFKHINTHCWNRYRNNYIYIIDYSRYFPGRFIYIWSIWYLPCTNWDHWVSWKRFKSTHFSSRLLAGPLNQPPRFQLRACRRKKMEGCGGIQPWDRSFRIFMDDFGKLFLYTISHKQLSRLAILLFHIGDSAQCLIMFDGLLIRPFSLY